MLTADFQEKDAFLKGIIILSLGLIRDINCIYYSLVIA